MSWRCQSTNILVKYPYGRSNRVLALFEICCLRQRAQGIMIAEWNLPELSLSVQCKWIAKLVLTLRQEQCDCSLRASWTLGPGTDTLQNPDKKAQR